MRMTTLRHVTHRHARLLHRQLCFLFVFRRADGESDSKRQFTDQQTRPAQQPAGIRKGNFVLLSILSNIILLRRDIILFVYRYRLHIFVVFT